MKRECGELPGADSGADRAGGRRVEGGGFQLSSILDASCGVVDLQTECGVGFEELVATYQETGLTCSALVEGNEVTLAVGGGLIGGRYSRNSGLLLSPWMNVPAAVTKAAEIGLEFSSEILEAAKMGVKIGRPHEMVLGGGYRGDEVVFWDRRLFGEMKVVRRTTLGDGGGALGQEDGGGVILRSWRGPGPDQILKIDLAMAVGENTVDCYVSASDGTAARFSLKRRVNFDVLNSSYLDYETAKILWKMAFPKISLGAV